MTREDITPEGSLVPVFRDDTPPAAVAPLPEAVSPLRAEALKILENAGILTPEQVDALMDDPS